QANGGSRTSCHAGEKQRMAGIPAQHFFQSRFDQNGSNQQVEKEKHACNQPYRRIVPALLHGPSAILPTEQQSAAARYHG
ncbi:hypothetical protein ACTHT3_20080, partial [Neisseria sp. P0015.S004]